MQIDKKKYSLNNNNKNVLRPEWETCAVGVVDVIRRLADFVSLFVDCRNERKSEKIAIKQHRSNHHHRQHSSPIDHVLDVDVSVNGTDQADDDDDEAKGSSWTEKIGIKS